MKKLIYAILSLLISTTLFLNPIFAEDVPIIVISPGKTAQSLNTVGSTVTVIEGDTINESSHFSLANIHFLV